MNSASWPAFVAASSLLPLLRGPAAVLVLRFALTRSRRLALATVASVALVDAVSMMAYLVSLGAFFMATVALFTLLKRAGAAYMIYLCVQLLRRAEGGRFQSSKDAPAFRAHSGFVRTAAVTALNPKSVAFF